MLMERMYREPDPPHGATRCLGWLAGVYQTAAGRRSVRDERGLTRPR